MKTSCFTQQQNLPNYENLLSSKFSSKMVETV